jgi:hypothetical protein
MIRRVFIPGTERVFCRLPAWVPAVGTQPGGAESAVEPIGSNLSSLLLMP